MNKPFVAAVAASLGAVLGAMTAMPASAQQALKPGLWQVQSRMPSDPEFDKSMSEMREQLAAMTPAERKQMEAAMGKHGVQFGAGPKGGAVTRFCMGREQAERKEVSGPQGDCTVGKLTRSGNTVTSTFTCANPKSSGESVIKYASAEAYSSKVTIVTQQGGKTDRTVMETDARWLSADCGALKPLGAKTK